MDNKKLAEAIDEYKEGNESAFIAIFNESADELLDFAEDLTDDKKDAQDLLRQTYVAVAEKLKDPDDDEDLFHFAGRKMLEVRGAAVPEEEKDGDAEDQMYASLFDAVGAGETGKSPDDGEKTVDGAVDGTLKKVCKKAVDGLSYRQKIAAQMYYGQEKSVSDIAEITGASETLVKSWLYQARTVVSGAVESYSFDNDVDADAFDHASIMRSIEKERLADGTFRKAPVAAQIVLGRIAGEAGLEDDAFDEFREKAEKVDAAAAQRRERQALEEQRALEAQAHQGASSGEPEGETLGDGSGDANDHVNGDGDDGKGGAIGSALLTNTSAAAAGLGAAELAHLKAAPERQVKKNFFQEKIGKIFDRGGKAGKTAAAKSGAASKGAAATKASTAVKGGAVARRVAVMLIAAGVAGGASYAGYHYYQGQLDPAKLSKSQIKAMFQDVDSSASSAEESLQENAEQGIADSEVISYLCGGRWGVPGTDLGSYTFKKDGTGIYNYIDYSDNDATEKITWSLEGSEITIKGDGDPYTITYDSSNHTFTINGYTYYREDEWDKVLSERYADDDSSQTDDSYSEDDYSDESDADYDEDFLYSDENWKY